MTLVCLGLIALAFLISTPATWAARAVGHRLGALDSPGSPGHVKVLRPVPNTGGVAIFAAFMLPLLAGLAAAWWGPADAFPEAITPHLEGIRAKTPLALTFLGCLFFLHLAGAIDDRRALPAGLKAAVMLATALTITLVGDGTRLVTMLDEPVGGPWLSVLITTLWIVGVTNAMNFIDNMDGLSGGVGAVAAACFLAAALLHGQWFVAACLALLIGSLLGFLVFNYPREPRDNSKGGGATIFMGDSGSLVLGFTLAFLTVRTTYVAAPGATTPEGDPIPAGGWYALFMPLVILAVPLYDIVSVTFIRLRLGKSPLVASPHHVSHRLVSYGLSKRDAVVVLWGLTAITGLSGVMLGSLAPWQAVLAAGQVLLLFIVIATLETKLATRKEHP
jgi:UDP-GlcNAc:undecaprenyl-phosphate/decaprenyl-phosphate GlcNAc-1-phosphate transferase